MVNRELSQRKKELYYKYSRVLQWGRAHPVEFASRFFGIELLDSQKFAIYNSWTKDFILWLEGRASGKALALDTEIPMFDGSWKTMKELNVGDEIIDADGKMTKITYTSPIFEGHDCYKLTFSDGSTVVADADHLWYLDDIYNNYNVIKATKDILNDYSFYAVPKLNTSNVLYIYNIKQVQSVQTKCISVDNKRELYVFGREYIVTHNTTKLAIYAMLRSILIPYHATYIIGNSGDQSKEAFLKIEKIVKKELESFLGTSDIFWDELKKNGPGSDGFTHNPASFRLEVFNGSNVNTLNSDIINIKGRRASAVMFDESGWLSNEMFIQCEQFVNQSSDFRLGGNVDVSLEPKSFPRQLIYTSSASDTESGFYSKFKQFTQRMLMGDDRYFACNFTVDMALHPTFNGKPYAPLIEQDKVDQSMASDKERAERELYNKFTSGSYEGQILTRREIMQHTERRKPLLTNDTGLRKFVCAWDSARINDNSAIVWAEFILDEEKGWTAHIHNVVTMVDINSKQKIQMRIPEQVERFKSLLLEYNGTNHGKMDYENIMAIMCDSGSGGQMVGGIADYIVEDWLSKDGKTHRGIIDSQHKANQAARYSFPNAIDIMKLIDPRGNRNEIFDSLEKMVKLGVVTFPIDFDGKDYFINIDDNGNEVRYDLNDEEQLALVQCDMLKTEITTMCKYVNGGSIRYEYPPDKRNKVRDDRAFACGLITYYLQRLRSGHAFEKKIEPIDMRQYTSLATKPALLNRYNTHRRR